MLSDQDNKSILKKLRQDRLLFRNRGPWYQRLSVKNFVPKRKPVDQKTPVRKHPQPKPSKRRQAITNVAAMSVLSFVLFWSLAPLLRRPAPTYTPNPGLNQRLDALFTAFNSQDILATERLQSDLKKLASRNGIDDASLDAIDALIKLAKNGEWAVAAKNLHQFIWKSPNRP